MPYIIVGIGNPGEEYIGTRHNLGFEIVDAFAARHGIEFKRWKYKAQTASGIIFEKEVILVKPMTYVNLSGSVVAALMRSLNASLSDLIVVCDDFNLPLGRVRLRRKGSSGGHKGLQSVVEHLGSHEFARLRVGIGSHGCRDPAEFVLERFSNAERKIVDDTVLRSVDVLDCLLKFGIEEAMNRFNKTSVEGLES